jgi:hypothetical protein
MKFTSFIKAYKVALASVCEKVSDWPKVYLGDLYLPDEDNPEKITFVFSNGPFMETGDLALSVSVNVFLIDSYYKNDKRTFSELAEENSLDKNDIIMHYIDTKENINETSRLLVLLEVVADKLNNIYENTDSILLKDVFFKFNDDLIRFEFSDCAVTTNGCLIMF